MVIITIKKNKGGDTVTEKGVTFLNLIYGKSLFHKLTIEQWLSMKRRREWATP